MKKERGFGEEEVKQYEVPNNPESLVRDFDLFLEQLNGDGLLVKEKKESESKIKKIYKKTLDLIKIFNLAVVEEKELEKPDQQIVEKHNKSILSLESIKEKFEEYKNQENNYDQNSEA